MQQMHRNLGQLLMLCVPLGLTACGAASDGASSSSEANSPFEAIIAGEKSSELPAIGMFDGGACTATLIAPRVILLAAHCLDFDATKSFLSTGLTGPVPSYPDYNSSHSFTVQTGSGDQSFDIKRFSVLATAYGDHDIAVAELDKDVPSSVATPLGIASEYPADGAPMSVWGYGASSGYYTDKGWMDLVWADGWGVKHRADSTWNAGARSTNDHVVCPGDSGGPTLNDRQEIVAVHSAATCTGGDDFDDNGDVVAAVEFIDLMTTVFGQGELCTRCPSIALRTSDGHYLQAVDGGGAEVTAESTEIGDWETFRVVSLGAGYVALQAQDGSFVSAEGGGAAGLRADQNRIGTWETFALPKTPTTLATIGSPRYYVSADNGGGGAVTVDRTEAGPWESFTWVTP